MGLYVGLALAGLGVVLIVAGARNRGAELLSTITGGSTLGTTVGPGAANMAPGLTGPATLPAAHVSPSTSGVMFA